MRGGAYPPRDPEVPMIKRIRRVAILLAAAAGLLAVSAQAAHAGMSLNHCEPLR
jgi:hypothetical protein